MNVAKNAAIYCRISSDRAGEGLGVARQQEDCEALAQRLGWGIGEVIIDNDRSAYSGRTRPGYEQLLAGLRDGTYDGVLAWHADRLHRRPIELEEYIHICQERGVRTHTVKGGEVDLATPEGMLRAGLMGQIARYESAHKSDRITRADKQAAEAGKFRGGARPFGYLDDASTPHPVEGPLVVAAYEAMLRGETLGSIKRTWETQGIVGTRGSKVTLVGIKKILLRQRNFGASVYRGEIVKRDAFTPLVSEDTYMAVRGVLTDPKRKSSTSSTGKWLLSGLARCGMCAKDGVHGTMGSASARNRATADPVRIYRCQDCGRMGRRAKNVDHYITEVVFERLSRTDAVNLLHDGNSVDVEGLRDEVAGLRAKLDSYGRLLAEEVMTESQFRDATIITKAKLVAKEAELYAPGQNPDLALLIKAPDMGMVWDEIGWARRRKVVDVLMVVTVQPVIRSKREFNPKFIEVAWR